MSTRLIAFVLAFIAAMTAYPAHAELLAPKHDSIESAVLKQKRDIDVYLPAESEKNPAQRYETIYVLDGDWNAKLVVQTVDFLKNTGFLPPVIVVSVPNFFDDKGVNFRDHDLTPTSLPREKNSGGAPQFLAFFKAELIPYVNQTYPSNGLNLVHGHSYGGLFLQYVIANDPSVFDGYVVLDPAMWWQDRIVVKQLEEKLATMPARSKAVYIAGRSGRAFKGMGVDALQPVYANKAPKELHWQLVAYPDETHDSLKFKGTYDALRFMFRGYSDEAVSVDPAIGIFAPELPLTLQANTDRFDVHYTTDGSEPTMTSPKMDHYLTLTDPSKMRIKSISARGEFDREILLQLTRGSLQASVRAKPRDVGRYRYAFYDARAWPDFREKAFDAGTTPDPDAVDVKRERYAGIIERDYAIPVDDYYLMILRTSSGARISIDGKTIIDVPHSTDHQFRSFVIPLKAGTHTVRYAFLHDKKEYEFEDHFFHFEKDDLGWEHDVK